MNTELLEVRPDSGRDLQRLEEAVARFARQASAGERLTVMITRVQRGATPAQAAKVLGVSRQFVDRLISSGKLTAIRLPGSTHRRVPLEALARFMRDRDQRRAALETAVRELDEVGADYE